MKKYIKNFLFKDARSKLASACPVKGQNAIAKSMHPTTFSQLQSMFNFLKAPNLNIPVEN
jgi:hypothetical protein